MKKLVKSDDPRKGKIVAALKQVSNCSKVTNVFQIAESKFQGDCLKYVGGRYLAAGTHQIEVTFES